MITTRYLLPAAALLGLVSAQTSALCTQSTATINSQADATALASSCSTVTGSVSLGSSIVGAVSLDGIQRILGDLTCVGAKNMTGLSGKDLSSIGGTMNLDSLFILANLGFPSLTTVSKAIIWQHLNGLQELGFGTTGITKCESLTITDTPLTSLEGINLIQVTTVNINNNRYLNTFNSKVANISGGLNMDANGPSLAVSFPSLVYAYNMTFRNISTISIPVLQSVNTTFGVYDSMDLAEIKAPNLTEVKGDIAFINNPSLSNISMPLLKTVGGGVTVSADKSLLIIDGFPSLKTTGAINMSGNFTSVSLPALADCKGTFNMQSSGNISCDPFAYAQQHQVIKGEYKCVGASTNVQSTVGQGAGSSTGTGTSASPTSTKNAAPISGFDMPAVMSFSAVVGALVQMLL